MDNSERPITTLFMLTSVDGKISTGATDEFDVDKDFPNITGVKDGLYQYYQAEQTTDLWSMCSGRTQVKIGVNVKQFPDHKSPVSFAIIDNSHLNKHGVRYLCALATNLVIITSNVNHPAFSVKEDNLHVMLQPKVSLSKSLQKLKYEYGCDRLTVQTGGTLNSLFLREKLIDYIDIVVAPVLIGGKDTSSLVDGSSITSKGELKYINALQLTNCKVLKSSYLRLQYKVL